MAMAMTMAMATAMMDRTSVSGREERDQTTM